MKWIPIVAVVCAGCGAIAERQKWGASWRVEVERPCPGGGWSQAVVEYQQWKNVRTFGADYWTTERRDIKTERCPSEKP